MQKNWQMTEKLCTIRKQETESSLIEAKTMFSSLSELSFDTWKEAKTGLHRLLQMRYSR